MRARPDIIRIGYIVEGTENVYTGLTYSYLERLLEKEDIKAVYITDMLYGTVKKFTKKDIKLFMYWWKYNYNNCKDIIELGGKYER